MSPKTIPELDVSNLEQSLRLYVNVLGFKILYARPENNFAYLDLNGIHLMLQEAAGPGRRFRTAPLEHPYGRGMNLQLEVDNVDDLHRRVTAANIQFVIPLEDKWYRNNDVECGNRQFVIADHDGYLLRFFSDLGNRTIGASSP